MVKIYDPMIRFNLRESVCKFSKFLLGMPWPVTPSVSMLCMHMCLVHSVSASSVSISKLLLCTFSK